ncbi:MAG: hypothetical protein ACNS62_01415 [Candidatus Cyclobacteriaceae bacterium M3_2C_046]
MKKSCLKACLFFISALFVWTGCNEEDENEMIPSNVPEITKIVPDHAFPGQDVVIYLSNYQHQDQLEPPEVTFAELQTASVLSVHQNEIKVKVPLEAATGNISVQLDSHPDALKSPVQFVVDQLPYQKLRINGDGGEESGYSVYQGQDFALLGTRAKGAVYYFKKNGQEWTETAILTPSVSVDEFGSALAVDGNYAVIGCGLNDYAFIFEKQGDNWIEKTYLYEGAQKSFGYSVAIHQDQVLVGATGENAVYIYQKDPGGQWLFKNKLNADSNEAFGSSISLDDNQLIIGATENQEYASGAGAAYIYQLIDGEYIPEQKILGEEANGHLGNSVAIRQNQAFIGAFYSQGQGEVFLYEKNESEWHQKTSFAPDRNDNTYGFGNDLALNGDLLVIGDYIKNSIYIYRESGTEWQMQEKITPPDSEDEDLFGKSISVYDQQVLVGAIGDNDVGTTSGSAYFIKLQ